VQTYVWRPRAERPPVALLSHGTGGHARELAWLAEALVDAGFAVAAPEHHGTSGEILPEGFAYGWERTRDLSFLLDQFDDLDTERVVAAGNSGGGFTVAALLGARLDRDVFQGLMNASNELSAALLSRNPRLRPAEVLAAATASYADERIAKAFLLAPVLGPVLDRASLAAIDRPVRIRWGESDDIAPPEENAAAYLAAIPHASGESLPCGHLEFSGDVFDPLGIRATVAEDVVAFFTAGRR
jgi:predicted dienelactone hydrolase